MQSLPIKLSTILALLSIFVFCSGFSGLKEHRLAGRTMGTVYHVKIIAPTSAGMDVVQKKIDHLLEQLNQSMSTYRNDSEISRFNKLTATGKPFAVSSDFLKVMMAADAIHDLTKGAWDGTVHPLVNLWGFGQSQPIKKVPAQADISKALENVGFNHIEVSAQGYLKKRRKLVTINLASIAKGYGVDMVAALISELGYRNFLVEIGGEVFASGRRGDGHQWKVGINRPDKDAAATDVYKALVLENRAMATSGDYRNYVKIQGRDYSHIIDPRNGYPVSNGVVSASVIAPNCTLADGLATALMIMGPTEGVQLLNDLEKVEGLIVVRRPDGTFEDYFSKGMVHQ